MLPQLIISVELIMQDQERLKENVVVGLAFLFTISEFTTHIGFHG